MEGHVTVLGEAMIFSSRFTDSFKKREFVVRTSEDGGYPQDIKLEARKIFVGVCCCLLVTGLPENRSCYG